MAIWDHIIAQQFYNREWHTQNYVLYWISSDNQICDLFHLTSFPSTRLWQIYHFLIFRYYIFLTFNMFKISEIVHLCFTRYISFNHFMAILNSIIQRQVFKMLPLILVHKHHKEHFAPEATKTYVLILLSENNPRT